MFWDKVSGVYDLFENIYNKSVYQATGESVAKYIKNTDRVLECACGAYGGGQRPQLRSSAAAVRPNGHPNIDS